MRKKADYFTNLSFDESCKNFAIYLTVNSFVAIADDVHESLGVSVCE